MKQKENILKGFVENISNKSFILSSKQTVVVDVIASLLDIISPRVRPVQYSSLSQQEKKVVAGNIRLLCLYSDQ
jgi:hypothetical protein